MWVVVPTSGMDEKSRKRGLVGGAEASVRDGQPASSTEGLI